MSAHDVSERLRAPAGAAQPAGGVPGRDRFRRACGLPVPAGEPSPDPAMFCLAPAAASREPPATLAGWAATR